MCSSAELLAREIRILRCRTPRVEYLVFPATAPGQFGEFSRRCFQLAADIPFAD
jgi:hypothetical protein